MQMHLSLMLWRSIELVSNVLLFSRLKLPTKTQSSTLRMSLTLLRDNIYNYDFGLYTKSCRFIMALLLAPSFIQQTKQYKSPLNVVYGSLILLDIINILDVVPSNSSEVLNSMIILIRILRIIDLIWDIFILLITIPKQTKQNYTLERPTILKEPKLECRLSKESQDSKESKEFNDSKESTAASQHISQKENSQQGKEKQSLKGVYPVFNFHIKTLIGDQDIVLEDPLQFESAFNELQLDRKTLLSVKLYFSSKVYESIKRQIHKKDRDLIVKYKGLIANYQSELMLFEY